MRRGRMLRMLASQAWAITPEGLEGVRRLLAEEDFDMEPMAPEDEEEQAEGVAIVRVCGPIVPRGNWLTRAFGMCASDELAARVRMAADAANVKGVVFDFDTGGGAVDGISEVAAEIARCSTMKPTVAVVNHWAASGGYWLAAQCGKIVGTEDAHVGSIGVYLLHEDFSKAAEKSGVKVTWIQVGKNKGENHPLKSLSASAKENLQVYAESVYSRFVGAVARGRGVDVETVKSDAWGKGRVIEAQDALTAGMIDEIGTLRGVVESMVTGQARVSLRSASAFVEAPEIPIGSAAEVEAVLKAQSEVSISEAVQASSRTSSYVVGDKVRVKHGKDHDGMGKDETGTVQIVSSPALGVKFPSMKAVHKWYVDEELEPASDEKASKALADSVDPLDNPDTRRAAAEENTMNEDQLKAAIEEGVKAAIAAIPSAVAAAVAPLSASVDELKNQVAEAKAQAAASAASSASERLDTALSALVESGKLSPAEVESEREMLAEAKPEIVTKRLAFLNGKTPEFKALTQPFVVAKVGDREATINAADFTIHGATPDPEGLDLVAKATAMAGGNSGEHYPAYRRALDQLTGGALGDN